MPIDARSELTELRRQILTMGATVEQRLGQAVTALVEADLDLAKLVRGGDDEIDHMEIEIEEHCLRLLALSQPVASDLRFVLAVLRINGELERIGDMAKGMSKRSLDIGRLGGHELPAALIEMANRSRRMVESALQAFADADAATARRVRQADDRVDDLQREVFAWARDEIPRHVEATEAAIDILSVARLLERIADMATNIAEDVIFLTEGSLVRHSSA